MVDYSADVLPNISNSYEPTLAGDHMSMAERSSLGHTYGRSRMPSLHATPLPSCAEKY